MEEKCIILRKKDSENSDRSLSFDVETLSRKKIRELRRDPNIAAIVPAIPMKLIRPARDKDKVDITPDEKTTWGIKAVGADSSPLTGEGIVVAVLDSGIDVSHPAFSGIEFVKKNFTGESTSDDVSDTIGHGTHCAGTIFGRDTNGMRIGVAPGVKKALIGKVVGVSGGLTSERLVEAIDWAFTNGANVISMSLAFDFPGYVKLLERIGFPNEVAVSHALLGYRDNLRLFENITLRIKQQADESRSGVIVAAAAGNESQRKKKTRRNIIFEIAAVPPGVIEDIISVAALERGEGGFSVAEFSNTNADISAPGVDIISASINGGLESKTGTSMATPHVAGVAALWAEKLKMDGQFNTKKLTSSIIDSATEQGLEEEFDSLDVGAGLVRAPQD